MEIWKPILSLNNKYEASNTGHIRNAITGKVLKEFDIGGYLCMTVRPEPYKQINIRVHQKVAEAFFGDKPKGYVVNHKDGDKHNNIIDNLEYVTSSENNTHALRTGLRHPAKMSLYSPRGEDSYLSTITEEEAIKILEYHYKTGFGSRRIEKELGYSRGVVEGLISKTRPRWKHINREKIKENILKEDFKNGK